MFNLKFAFSNLYCFEACVVPNITT